MKTSQVVRSDLLHLGKSVYLRKAFIRNVEDIGRKDESVRSPSLILLFGWMGAQLPHILKYSNTYSEMYPYATQVIVRSDPSYFWSSKNAKRASVQPVVDALDALGCLPPALTSPTAKLLRAGGVQPVLKYPTPSLLVHAFSNGGAWQLTTLSELLSSRSYSPTSKLSPAALVLDSCPGNGGVDGTIKAFSGLVHNPVLRGIISFVIRLLYLYASIRRKLSLTQAGSVFDKMKARLNTERLLPWFTKDTPRLYFFSLKDDVIPHHEVERHAEHAKEAGLNVKIEKFDDSKHVQHARADPDRYWRAVRMLWEDAVRRTEDKSIS